MYTKPEKASKGVRKQGFWGCHQGHRERRVGGKFSQGLIIPTSSRFGPSSGKPEIIFHSKVLDHEHFQALLLLLLSIYLK